MIVKMAWIGLWRRKTRTFIVVFMIAISLMSLLVMQGFYDGMVKQIIDDAIHTDGGHIMIEHEEYKVSKKLSDNIEDPDTLAEKLRQIPEVQNVRVRLKNEGMVTSPKTSSGVTIIGIDLKEEAEFGKLNSYLIEGVYELRENKNDVIIGAELVKKLKIKLGNKIILTCQNSQKELSSGAFRVKGILRANNAAIDKYAVFLTRSKAETLFASENTATQISLLLTKRVWIDQTITSIKAMVPENIKVMSWQEYYPLFEKYESVLVYVTWISYGVIFFVVALGVFDILLVSVLERMREFGIMKAVGTSNGMLARMIFAESFITGFFGFLVGSMLGALALWYLSSFGLDLSYTSEGLQNIGMSTVLYATLKARYFLDALIAVFAATFIAALIPIRILVKLKPIEAIRFH